MDIIRLSSTKYLAGCLVAAATLFWMGQLGWTSAWVLAAEVILTILSLFILGSFHYQLDKNALTCGAGLVNIGTFIPLWWPQSYLRQSLTTRGAAAWIEFIHHHFLALEGLDHLVHADTMLFILGLTCFVSVIAQTRILETVSGKILRHQKGRVLSTVALLAGVGAACSGVLDGVSMIGLMIRSLVIILMLGHAEERDVIFAVILSTVITTVSGLWMAYGEPPNLIMKANLFPQLGNAFFLRYGVPVALGSYLIVVGNLRVRLKGLQIDLKTQDVLDAHNADIRFLQASLHGEVFTPLELLETWKDELDSHFKGLHRRLLRGESLGESLILEAVPPELRLKLLGHFVSESLAHALEEHYQHLVHHQNLPRDALEIKVRGAIAQVAHQRLAAQRIGVLSFLPFIGLLIVHGSNPRIPLFLSSFAGFAAASMAISGIPKMQALALQEAKNEYKEYLFLFPLFLSITLLQNTGFFIALAGLLKSGISSVGMSHVACIQYWGVCFLSAFLDNNVVADFASKALHGLSSGTLHLFAMAQIAGYAVGGCWTHIGCAQAVVAYAFIRKEINPRYTPILWMKDMTVVLLEVSFFVTLMVYLEGWLLSR